LRSDENVNLNEVFAQLNNLVRIVNNFCCSRYYSPNLAPLSFFFNFKSIYPLKKTIQSVNCVVIKTYSDHWLHRRRHSCCLMLQFYAFWVFLLLTSLTTVLRYKPFKPRWTWKLKWTSSQVPITHVTITSVVLVICTSFSVILVYWEVIKSYKPFLLFTNDYKLSCGSMHIYKGLESFVLRRTWLVNLTVLFCYGYEQISLGSIVISNILYLLINENLRLWLVRSIAGYFYVLITILVSVRLFL
jgi:hypothetical protein